MENTSFTWENKVVAITGGSRGIGKAIGLEAQSRGAKISVCDINQNDLSNVSNEHGFLINNCDVGKESGIIKFVSETEQNLGDIDIFFANAGIACLGDLSSTSDENWNLSMNVNTWHHVWAAKAVIPKMRKRKNCRFVTTASAAGLLSEINSASYSLTKHAAVGFAEYLSIVYGKDDENGNAVHISCLCPQGVKTAMTANMKEGNVAGIDGMLEVSEVAAITLNTVSKGEFLILPHPQVGEYIKLKTSNYPRWLGGMRKLYAKFGSHLN